MPSGYAILTPWLIPDGTAKSPNIGDYFITDAAIKLIGSKPRVMASSWVAHSGEDLERINDCRLVVAVLANGLHSAFRLPGMDLIKAPVAVMGIGLNGTHRTQGRMDAGAIACMGALLERFPLVSVRCDRSVAYLQEALPDRADAMLMTSCPAIYPVDGLDAKFERKSHYGTVVVSFTRRNESKREIATLEAAQSLFPADSYVLAVHQLGVYQSTPPHKVQKAADELGFEQVSSQEDLISLYQGCDVHYGSRVHGHLKALANGIPSWLTPFELRQEYFAESLDCPLAKDDEPDLEYDFSRFVRQRERAKPAMDRFVAAVTDMIG